jgi:NADH:ubiquinone oxidoreductase subunit H
LVFFILLLVILAVAFLTLFERHTLRLSQGRLGPNKVFFFGVAQAFLDGVKLLKKEQVVPNKVSVGIFLFLPGAFFCLFFFEFFCVPFFFFFLIFSFLFFFYCVWLGCLFIF